MVAPTAEQLAFLTAQRVGRLATADSQGRPYTVPVCYVYNDGCIYSPLDEKPKSVDPRKLKRIKNIMENPSVALVVDHYSDDWSTLAYVQVRGQAALVEPGEPEHAPVVGLLRAKYPQYREMAIHSQPMIRIAPERYASWGALDMPGRSGLGLMEVIRGRRSVRWYTDEPVASALVETILEAGRWAPSPHGRQPWRFAVITNPSRKQALVDAMSETWQAQLSLDGQDPEVISTRLRKSQQRLGSAPVIVLLCLYLQDLDVYPDAERQTAETTMAVQSLGAAAQNMLLAAYGHGLDGGWMCAPLFCPEVVAETLGLSPTLVPHAMLTFGYPAADPKRRPRRPLNELIELYD